MRELAGLRICLLAGTLGQGGAERQLFYAVQTLRACHAEVCVLSLTSGEFWQSRIEALGVPVEWVGRTRSRTARLGRIIHALRRHRPDVVQAQHFFTNLYVVAASRAVGAREIGALRSDGFSEVRANGTLVGRLSLRLPALIAANSRAAIGNARALGASGVRFHLLPNVVDTTWFQPGSREPDGTVRLLAVGRPSQTKRFDRFLRVLTQARARSQAPVKGVIVGPRTSNGMQPLVALADQLGLPPDAVEFVESVADVMPFYQGADILVVSSDYEGTPNVVLEAMACGLPIVATRAGGIPEVVRNGDTGFLADVGDERSMADSIVRLVHDAGLRAMTGARAREYVKTTHSLSELPRRLAELYATATA